VAEDGHITVQAELTPFLSERINRSIQQGLRAYVRLEVRLREAEGERALFAERSICELDITRVIFYDSLDGRYQVRSLPAGEMPPAITVEGEGECRPECSLEEGTVRYDSFQDALERAFRLDELRLQANSETELRRATVELRAVVKPLVLAQPIRIVAPLLPDYRNVGPWHRARIELQ